MESVKIQYPRNLGISGIVLKTKKLYVQDNAKRDAKFQNEIDNLSSAGEVHSFMIGPIFGHKSQEEPIALLQFINKADQRPIS